MTPLWISETEVTTLLSLQEAIEVVESALLAEAHGAAHNMEKTHVAWEGGHTLHALGACFPHARLAGTKTWAHTSGGAMPLLIVFDAESGALRAIIEAFALGQMRTAAIAGVATRWLAMPSAVELAIIGTGAQAWAQVAAVAAVRPLRRVRVFSPTPEHREAFAARLRAMFGFTVSVVPSVAEAVEGAPIITLATRARAPFLEAALVTRGAHINAMGAITPERAELAQDIFPRCGRVVVDTLPAAQHLARELIDRYGTQPQGWADVLPLSRMIVDGSQRRSTDDLTVFKSMGMGIADLAVGSEVLQRATARGLGRPLAPPARAAIRLRSDE